MFCAITSAWCERDQIYTRAPSPSKAFACILAISHQGIRDLKGQESGKEVQRAALVKGQQK